MRLNFSLRKRIILGFSLQTVLIFCIAYLTITSYVDYIEESVLYDYFDNYLDSYVDYLEHQRTPVIPEGIHIFPANAKNLPDYARDVLPGGQEVMLDSGQAFHVFSKEYASNSYILISDQTEFEQMEITINNLTLVLLLLFMLVSIMFSMTLANRIVSPIRDLAQRVSSLNVKNIKQSELEYPDDEVGSLVKIIYEQIYTLDHYLQREKWFTGDISHELRTPMMVVSSSVDLLKQDKLTEEQQKQLYQRIEGAVAQVNELINTFLLLARDKSDQQAGPLMTDIHEVAVKVVESLSAYCSEHRTQVMIEPPETVLAQVSATFLSVVLTNLVKNALFNTQDGQILIQLEPDCIRVSDSGKGLPDFIKRYVNDQEVMDHRENGHLGLGLSIVKRICEKENWTFHAVDSELGGAGFVISF